ncbi:MAG: tetratricopeptide repeat protein [Anaerolineaceae bacterium]|nr:tetratricopeptide repeat protein [Anaerolineaceae bacterium]
MLDSGYLHCKACGFHNPPGMRYCGACGTLLSTAAPPDQSPGLSEQLGTMMGSDLLERFRQAGLEASGQRRNVTVLFVDLSGFTPLSESLEPDVLYELVQKFIRVLADDVYKYEGMVDKLTGDGLMALFGAPIAYENNTERAMRAALDMLEDVRRLSLQLSEELNGHELHIHVGINDGSVIVGGVGSNHLMNYTAIGDTVNIASRLESASEQDQILVSDDAYRRTAPLFNFREPQHLTLKGVSETIVVHQLVSPKASPGSTRGMRELKSQFIGRKSELTRVNRVIQNLHRKKQGGLVLVIGEAGIGKSRLMREAKSSLDEENLIIIEGTSLTYRKSIPYWIFRDALRRYLQLHQTATEEELKDRIHSVVNELLDDRAKSVLPYVEYMLSLPISDPQTARSIQYLNAEQLQLRIFLSMRQLLSAAAKIKPVLLILDDLHWADESSLDLINFLVDVARNEPILIYGISRPFEGGSVDKIRNHALNVLPKKQFTTIELQTLDPIDTNELFNTLLSLPNFPESFRAEIIQRSAGLPLYMEEIIRMLIEDEVIYYEDDQWKMNSEIDPVELGVPETLQGLILTRFDRLSITERNVIQTAAVNGNPFSVAVLKKVLNRFTSSEIDDILNRLTDRQFIYPLTNGSVRRYQFRHGLVSDAIYSTLLQRERKNLHGKVARAIESFNPTSTDDLVELLAHHYNNSAELDKALHYSIIAGQKAMHGYANEQARQHFVTALSLLTKVGYTTEQAYNIQTGLGDILVVIGEYPAARRHYSTALEIVLEDGSTHWLRQQSKLHRKIASTFERQGDYEKALGRLQAAEMALNEMSDDSPIEYSQIFNDIGWIYFRRGNMDQAEELLKKSLDLVEHTEAYDVISSIYNRLGGIYFLKGDMDLSTTYVQRSLQLREQLGEVASVARSYNNLGLIAWKRGVLDEAQKNFEKSSRLQEDLGDIEALIELNANLGLLHLDQGNMQSAENYLLEATDKAKQIGHPHHLSSVYLNLTELYLLTENWERALQHIKLAQKEAERTGGNEFSLTIQVNFGLAYLGLGKIDQAKTAVEESLTLIENTEKSQASVPRDDQGRLFLLRGRIAEHEKNFEQAFNCYDEGQRIFESTDHPLQVGRMLTAKGLLRLSEDRKQEAETLFDQAEEIFTSHGARRELDYLRHVRQK